MSEGYETLDDQYIMKGYMLKLSTPPIQAGTDVTWSIKKGAQEVGTYHDSGAWTAYNSPLQNKPTTPTVYWRSDTAGAIDDTYTITATYRPQGAAADKTISRQVKSRLLDPAVAEHRNQFNEDADMAQRAMIQIFYLDKGRLEFYRIGKYDTGTAGFYRSSRTITVKAWSPIADEVDNFDWFALGHFADHSTELKLRVVQGIWTQFSEILQAGAMGQINANDPNYNNWLTAAAGSLPQPPGFPRTNVQILNAQQKKESPRPGTPWHSWARFDPLAVSSVDIGQALKKDPDHTYTDGGLGFGKVQPYNKGTRNLYKPDENMLREAGIMNTNIYAADNPGGPDINAKVWFGYYRYNAGNYGNGTPAQLRAAGEKGAVYADAIFQNYLQLPLP